MVKENDSQIILPGYTLPVGHERTWRPVLTYPPALLILIDGEKAESVLRMHAVDGIAAGWLVASGGSTTYNVTSVSNDLRNRTATITTY